MISRRAFLHGAAALAGVSVGGAWAAVADAEPPPETRRIRIVQIPGLCVAPQYVVEDLLRAEGFTKVTYVRETEAFGTAKPLATGAADVSLVFAGPRVLGASTRGSRSPC